MRWGLAVIPAMLGLALPTTQVAAAETDSPAFVTIDHPGAGTGVGQGTFPQGPNNRTVVGYYVDGGGRAFGWRYDDGRFTDINDPLADNTVPGRGTMPISQSENGREVVGAYADATGLFHGFTLRGGRYTTLDVPFAGASGTFAQGVDDAGLISGAYLDSSGNFHGFTLWRGQYTAVNYPEPEATGTALVSMNNHGTVAGVWDQGTAMHGFLYRAGKVVAHIDDPNGAGTTFPFCVNDHMTAAGQYTDSSGTTHGFTWDGGRYTTVDDPAGPTSGLCIADNGTITGVFTDAGGAAHGFISREGDD
jgi:hypothetical protein